MDMKEAVPQQQPSHEYPPKSRWSYAVLMAILIVSILIVSLVFVFPFLANLSSEQLVSSDWSGYFVVSNLVNPQPNVTSLNGSWTVPTVKISATDSYSAIWIGIGGQFDDSLIQVGTEQDSRKGRAAYSAWYELLPANPITIDSINVSQGDQIEASISLLDPNTTAWSLKIEDITNGQSLQRTLIYASSMLSAEWIVERPSVGVRLSTLADFGQVEFTQCTETINGKDGNISTFSHAQVRMVNRSDTDIVRVSSLTSGGSSFTVSYVP
jgi:hypothetical protein